MFLNVCFFALKIKVISLQVNEEQQQSIKQPKRRNIL